jgi:hypothetical protein
VNVRKARLVISLERLFGAENFKRKHMRVVEDAFRIQFRKTIVNLLLSADFAGL